MLDSKMCKCTKSNYTKFLGACGGLQSGLTIWCGIILFLDLINVLFYFSMGSLYFPIIELIGNCLGLAGARKEGPGAAKFLRMYSLFLIAGAISSTIVLIYLIVFYCFYWSDDDFAWIECLYMSIYWLFSISLCHMLVSSAESLACLKENEKPSLLPIYKDDCVDNQYYSQQPHPEQQTYNQNDYPGQYETPGEPQVVVVRHVIEGLDAGQRPTTTANDEPTGRVNLEKN
eukprot:GHVH01000164.1.p1 GENE.GHVH01000164.1~~GHVH01000164.1.p1  ORF type:complete len:230 (+),score=35.63 GHVH01000164.1:132-821(+)